MVQMATSVHITEMSELGSFSHRLLFRDKHSFLLSPWHDIPLQGPQEVSSSSFVCVCTTPAGAATPFELAIDEPFEPLRAVRETLNAPDPSSFGTESTSASSRGDTNGSQGPRTKASSLEHTFQPSIGHSRSDPRGTPGGQEADKGLPARKLPPALSQTTSYCGQNKFTSNAAEFVDREMCRKARLSLPRLPTTPLSATASSDASAPSAALFKWRKSVEKLNRSASNASKSISSPLLAPASTFNSSGVPKSPLKSPWFHNVSSPLLSQVLPPSPGGGGNDCGEVAPTGAIRKSSSFPNRVPQEEKKVRAIAGKAGAVADQNAGKWPWNIGFLPQTLDDIGASSLIASQSLLPAPLPVVEIGSPRRQRVGEVYAVKLLGMLMWKIAGATQLSRVVLAIAESNSMAPQLHGVDDVMRSLPGLVEAIYSWLLGRDAAANGPEGRILAGAVKEASASLATTLSTISTSHSAWKMHWQQECQVALSDLRVISALSNSELEAVWQGHVMDTPPTPFAATASTSPPPRSTRQQAQTEFSSQPLTSPLLDLALVSPGSDDSDGSRDSPPNASTAPAPLLAMRVRSFGGEDLRPQSSPLLTENRRVRRSWSFRGDHVAPPPSPLGKPMRKLTQSQSFKGSSPSPLPSPTNLPSQPSPKSPSLFSHGI
eukprot:TRINITY_DN10671_c0_g1_i1.p1 TRINITY_DN10671_c0_g1~~TRINITY_DN10671_c0_g1_i1.p1  ORF type:complete len:658 (+),score=90.38 TRINITY_DN10671_c0_g1_i1:134-2107(+)